MDTVVVADGFSCRTQIHQLDSGGREAVHLAEVVRAALQGDAVPAGQPPEQAYAARPREPSVAARLAAIAGPVAAVGAAGLARAPPPVPAVSARRRRTASRVED